MLVASWTAPTLVVVELVIEITEPSKVVVATIGAIAVTGGGACHTKLPDPSVYRPKPTAPSALGHTYPLKALGLFVLTYTVEISAKLAAVARP
jgi:hypothetical protein